MKEGRGRWEIINKFAWGEEVSFSTSGLGDAWSYCSRVTTTEEGNERLRHTLETAETEDREDLNR